MGGMVLEKLVLVSGSIKVKTDNVIEIVGKRMCYNLLSTYLVKLRLIAWDSGNPRKHAV